MKYTKVVICSLTSHWDTGQTRYELAVHRWLTDKYGPPGTGRTWFARLNRRVMQRYKIKNKTYYNYGIEKCVYFKNPHDAVMFGLSYNG